MPFLDTLGFLLASARCSSSIAACTRRRIGSETCGPLFKTSETVLLETCALRAISERVGMAAPSAWLIRTMAIQSFEFIVPHARFLVNPLKFRTA